GGISHLARAVWLSSDLGSDLSAMPGDTSLIPSDRQMWLYSFRRLGTSGPAFAPVAVLLSHVPVFRQLTRFSSIVCLQRPAPGPTQFCKAYAADWLHVCIF